MESQYRLPDKDFGTTCQGRSPNRRGLCVQTMFFLIAGVQPKTIDIDDHPRICPSCGLYRARLKRVDHYLSVFFLPILKVKKGSPFLDCQRCGSIPEASGKSWFGARERSDRACPHCGNTLEQAFSFCPYCGKPI